MSKITIDRAVLQQALEDLQSCSTVTHWPELVPTVDALRAALEQPQVEQEPIGEAQDWNSSQKYTHCIWDARVVPVGTKLYTHPKPPRQLLTDKEIADLWGRQLFRLTDLTLAKDFARDIERAHGITGEVK